MPSVCFSDDRPQHLALRSARRTSAQSFHDLVGDCRIAIFFLWICHGLTLCAVKNVHRSSSISVNRTPGAPSIHRRSSHRMKTRRPATFRKGIFPRITRFRMAPADRFVSFAASETRRMSSSFRFKKILHFAAQGFRPALRPFRRQVFPAPDYPGNTRLPLFCCCSEIGLASVLGNNKGLQILSQFVLQ